MSSAFSGAPCSSTSRRPSATACRRPSRRRRARARGTGAAARGDSAGRRPRRPEASSSARAAGALTLSPAVGSSGSSESRPLLDGRLVRDGGEPMPASTSAGGDQCERQQPPSARAGCGVRVGERAARRRRPSDAPAQPASSSGQRRSRPRLTPAPRSAGRPPATPPPATSHATSPPGSGPMAPMPQPPRSSGWRWRET